MTVIRVLLADDNAFVRQALCDFLNRTPGIEVVAVCGDGDEVLAAAQSCLPDVAVLDVVMRRVGGLEAARRLLAVQPSARVLMLTASPSQETLQEARQLGAAGYVLKTQDPTLLPRAVHVVANGGTAWADFPWAPSPFAGEFLATNQPNPFRY
jgi:DNA-binding NarL/FixJ family response regulator